MDKLATASNVSSLSDWRKVTTAVIQRKGGRVCHLHCMFLCIAGITPKVQRIYSIYTQLTIF